MRITVEAKIERANGSRQTMEVVCLERAREATPSCGIGVLLSESRELLSTAHQDQPVRFGECRVGTISDPPTGRGVDCA